MYSIVVAPKGQSNCVGYIEHGHYWSVEGDYGFLGSFETQNEAWNYANTEARTINEANGDYSVEVLLND